MSRRAPITPEALKLAVLTAPDGTARGEAGGWHLVLSRPGMTLPDWAVAAARTLGPPDDVGSGYPAHRANAKQALTQWWLSARRLDGMRPGPAHLAFVQRFVVSLGGPEMAGDPSLVVGSWYWKWTTPAETRN